MEGTKQDLKLNPFEARQNPPSPETCTPAMSTRLLTTEGGCIPGVVDECSVTETSASMPLLA